MHNLDPNDMDALFREGADNHEFTYNPEAWALMEEKLDKKDRRIYIYWLLLGVLFIGLGVGTYSYLNTGTSKDLLSSNKDRVEIAESSIEKSNVPQLEDRNIEQGISNVDLETYGSQIDNSQQEITKLTTQNASQVRHNIDTNTHKEYINTVSKVRSHDIVAQNSFQSEGTGSLVQNEVVSIFSQTGNNEETNKKQITTKKIDIKELKQIDYINGLDLMPIEKEVEKLDFDNLAITQNSLNTPLLLSSANRFSFTAYTSAEFSSVGFLKESRAGWKVGLKAGYQFSKKYQLDLGVAISHKRYGSEGSEYTNDAGWVDNIMPTWMDAKCNVIEIPLELSYYLNGYKNDGFFFNAGLSSYILNSEWYGFKYEDADLLVNPNLLQEINPEEVEMNYHLSGVGKISFGYQKIMSPNMAIEISPYLQIPLTGIGEGKVDLYTTGVQFAVKFNTK